MEKLSGNKEQILCAAIHYDNGIYYENMNCYKINSGFVLCGYRHCNIISVLPTNPHYHEGITNIKSDYTRPNSSDCCTQGFITTTGRFVDRIEAVKIAKLSGQIGDDFIGNYLYSEDLY